MSSALLNPVSEIAFPASKISVDLSAGQFSVAGKVLHRLYYIGKYKDLLELAPNRWGYPHHGALHILNISGTPEDCLTYCSMLAEVFPELKKLPVIVLDKVLEGQSTIRLASCYYEYFSNGVDNAYISLPSN